MKVIVFGSTGGTGRAVIAKLLSDGYEVTAFARDTAKLEAAPQLKVLLGDAINAVDVAKSIPGHDAVVVSLGNSQNPFALLLGARRTTARNVCEQGTRNIIAAVKAASPVPIIVVTAYGIGDTRDRVPFMVKLFYRLFLREHMADKEKQEPVVKASGLDWVLIQPVALTDKPATGKWLASVSGEVRGQEVARADLAAFIVRELAEREHTGKTVAFSG
ncbi:MAG: SDR family oxidoreductase [Chitinophagales bacterium]|nr:SDR family oxidoreductase [Hyphomicrobiales bacterium]